jgi:hypothetical protein
MKMTIKFIIKFNYVTQAADRKFNTYIQSVSGGIVNILGGGSMDYSE